MFFIFYKMLKYFYQKIGNLKLKGGEHVRSVPYGFERRNEGWDVVFGGDDESPRKIIGYFRYQEHGLKSRIYFERKSDLEEIARKKKGVFEPLDYLKK